MATIGVDTGGTFTDLVRVEKGRIDVVKLPSTPHDPGAAVAEGVARLGGAARVVHGTTVALNALLTGRLARMAFVTNEGFADLLEIGRQDRPDLYALEPRKPAPLVPEELCFEVPERTWPDPATGELVRVRVPTRDDLDALRERVRASGATSIAIALLHAYGRPEIEREVADALRPLGLPITCSAELVPEHREVERATTAAVNASLRPLMERYLGGLAGRVGGAQLALLRSSGGSVPAARAALEPVRVLLSGPAGGVVGAAAAARDLGLARVLTLDLGGTSTDVAFARTGAGERDAVAVDPPRVAGHTLAVPALDVHTIGCGGGSLARVDAAGVLTVGPESAGADPGPACHGVGDAPTVTDAHVVLGHVGSGAFLGGAFELDVDAAHRVYERLGARFGVGAREAARAVLSSARTAMRRAALAMSSQRGLDPATLPLVAFGGGGGLHAAALAELLGAPLAVVPRHPGALSALGMALAPAEGDASRTVLEPLARWDARRRRAALDALATEACAALVAEGARPPFRIRAELDLRYRGQSFELRLTDTKDASRAFHAAHERLFGYALETREVELVALRASATSRAAPRARVVRARRRPPPAAARGPERTADFGAGGVATATWFRAALPPGSVVRGPACIEEYTATTLVPPGWRAEVAAGGHLVLARAQR